MHACWGSYREGTHAEFGLCTGSERIALAPACPGVLCAWSTLAFTLSAKTVFSSEQLVSCRDDSTAIGFAKQLIDGHDPD